MIRPPPSLCSIVSAALVLAFGPRFSLGEHQEAGLVEPDGVRLWRVRHGSVPGWATGQPLPPLDEDDAENQEEGRLVRFREDCVANWLSGPAAAVPAGPAGCPLRR